MPTHISYTISIFILFQIIFKNLKYLVYLLYSFDLVNDSNDVIFFKFELK